MAKQSWFRLLFPTDKVAFPAGSSIRKRRAGCIFAHVGV